MPKIPEHELLQPIAAGAYGQVWLARNALGTLRAVKIVRRDHFERAEDFQREFRGLQRFEPVSRTHEALVDVLQIGDQDNWFYYVMELADNATAQKVNGGEQSKTELPAIAAQCPDETIAPYIPLTLRQRIRECGFLPAHEVITLGHRLASALAHLHANGLVHRDVKPSNIVYVKGQAKLADAGLVAPAEDACSMVGTAGYIAPEGQGKPRADIYGLGKVLYEAAFGKGQEEFPQIPLDLVTRPDHAILLELNEIISKACAHDPRQRHADARALASELDLLQHGGSIKRQRLLDALWVLVKKVGLASALISLIVLGTILILHREGTSHTPPKDTQAKILMEQADYVAGDESRRAQASQLYRKVIALEPNFAPAWSQLFLASGPQQWEPGHLNTDAREALARLKELAPDSAEYHNYCAMLQWADYRFSDALAEVRLATQKREIWKDGLEFAHTMYGAFALRSGQPDLALKQYQAAEKLSGSDAYIQLQLGHPYFVKGEFDEALKKYQKSLELITNWAPGRHYQGLVFQERKEFLRAINEFEASFDDISDKTAAETNGFFQALRDAYNGGGEKAYWEKRLELALKDSPQNRYYIATLHARLGHKEAYAWLRDACDHHAIGQVMLDRCWDHDDPDFQKIVRSIGLVR